MVPLINFGTLPRISKLSSPTNVAASNGIFLSLSTYSPTTFSNLFLDFFLLGLLEVDSCSVEDVPTPPETSSIIEYYYSIDS